jgi:lipid-A-disaccharide synthase-like uncharacterized protein
MTGLLSLDQVALVGYAGQLAFASRFGVQWVVSEVKRKSTIPIAFWYLSGLGGVLLLAYALLIGSGPIAVGQLFGLLVYARNLRLVQRERALARRAAQGESPSSPPM